MSDSVHSQPVGLEDLQNLVGELRMMARRLLAGEAPHSFTPTALAMTALRRAKHKEEDWDNVRWENRAHFFHTIATAMRHALIDHARRRRACKRDGLVYFSPDSLVMGDLAVEAEERPERILLIEEAVAAIEAADPRLSEVINQYYYANYTVPEMAQFAGVSEKTIDRELKRARTLLKKTFERLSTAP